MDTMSRTCKIRRGNNVFEDKRSQRWESGEMDGQCKIYRDLRAISEEAKKGVAC